MCFVQPCGGCGYRKIVVLECRKCGRFGARPILKRNQIVLLNA
jgi:hypothetical protein